MRIIKRLLQWLLVWILRIDFLKKKAVFLVKYYYFKELNLFIPLGAVYKIPLMEQESVHAFSEVFVEREYDLLLNAIDVPKRWVDLGCHRGYFSLWLASHYKKKWGHEDFEAFLVDADPRAKDWVGALIESNGLHRQFHWMYGAIGHSVGQDTVRFGIRQGMLSSNDCSIFSDCYDYVQVPCLIESDLVEPLKEGYDLLKVDIEGGEYFFIEHYKDLMRLARAMVIEWHVYGDDVKNDTMDEQIYSLGFIHKVNLRPWTHCVHDNVRIDTCVDLYLKK